MSDSARSKDQSSDISDSSSSSISPTSGYSSYDLIDQVQCRNSDQDLDKRKSGICLSVRDSRQNKWKAERRASNDSRSQSVPMISRDENAQDYTTGIKPASHRIENPRSSWCVKSSESTPMHSAREGKTFSTVKNYKRSIIFERKGSDLTASEKIFSPQKVQIKNDSIPRYILIFSFLSFPESTRMHDYFSSPHSF